MVLGKNTDVVDPSSPVPENTYNTNANAKKRVSGTAMVHLGFNGLIHCLGQELSIPTTHSMTLD
jgi:hypothetical protein